MPNFNKEAAKRGNQVIERASNGNNTTFRPFLPKIYWKEAGDEHYILILNQLEDIMRLQFHPFIETEDGPRSIIARTDPAIGERNDPIEDEWDYTPRVTDLMIAVELEPIFEQVTVNGRNRDKVSGFGVVTRTIERRIRDEDGELTDDKEEVEIPQVGYIAQSPYNFSNQLNSYEHSENPIHLTPFKITQVGEGSGTSYLFDGKPDAEFDLTNLLEYIENISFLQYHEEVLDAIDGLDQIDAGLVIGQFLLDLKLEELADPAYYDEIFKAITKPSRYAKKDKKDSKSARPKRTSQRREVSEDNTKEKPTARSRKAGENTSNPSALAKLEELRAAKAAKEAAKEAV